MSVWSSDYYYGSGRPMTEQWQTLPANLTVRCPRCGGRALFDEPFGYAHVSQGLPEDARPPVQQRGDWHVWAKYPAVLGLPLATANLYLPTVYRRQKDGPPQFFHQGSYALREQGVLKCYTCHLVTAHKLVWPADAYYQWVVRGARIWAPSREFAEVLLRFLGSKQRNARHFPGYAMSLARLPRGVIAAKSREAAVQAISRTLAGEP